LLWLSGGRDADTAPATTKAKPMTKPRPKTGPGHCQVCNHDRRHLIDLALICGEKHTTLARRFGVSADSLSRHAAKHLTPTQRAALITSFSPSAVDLEQISRSESENLLAHLVTQRARLATMASSALEADPPLPNVAVRCEAAILNNLELVSRLLGQIVTRTEITSRSILLTPQYIQLRQILIEELRGSPEIAARIAQRIAALENEAAAEITAKSQPVRLLIEPPAGDE
jgi:hypothetical protein